MSDQPPEVIIDMLNRYYAAMTQIYRYDGTIVQFVGDEIMALFGAPSPIPAPAAPRYAAHWTRWRPCKCCSGAERKAFTG